MLILDEPTNHLDWPACGILERALVSFSGTLLVVSHDRLFLDQVVTKIWSLDHKRKVMTEHLGNYTAFRDHMVASSTVPSDKLLESNTKKPGAALREQQKDRERKRKRQQQLENQIAALEQALSAIQQKMADTQDDWKTLEELQRDKEKTERHIDNLMVEWASFEAGNN